MTGGVLNRRWHPKTSVLDRYLRNRTTHGDIAITRIRDCSHSRFIFFSQIRRFIVSNLDRYPKRFYYVILKHLKTCKICTIFSAFGSYQIFYQPTRQ